MATRIQLRRDTSSNWTSLNPTLSQGEIGYETNTNQFKIGDGATAWSGLSYFSTDLSAYATTSALNSGIVSASAAAVTYLVDSAPAALDTLNELAAALNDDANFSSTITTALGNKLDASSASTTYQTKNLDIIAAKTGAYTVGSGDQGDLIQLSGSSAYTVSIPTDATFNFSVGTQINLLNTGTGVKTIAAVTPGTTSVNGTPGLKLRAQWSSATLIKLSADNWVVVGDLSA